MKSKKLQFFLLQNQLNRLQMVKFEFPQVQKTLCLKTYGPIPFSHLPHSGAIDNWAPQHEKQKVAIFLEQN